MAIDIAYLSPLKVPSFHKLSLQRMRRYDNGFPQNLTISQSVQYLEEEINALNPERVVIYSNYERLNVERLRQKGPKDESAICLELGVRGKAYTIVCDTWYLVEHNLYALHLALRAFRNMEKWGVKQIEDAMLCFSNTVQAAQSDDNKEERISQSEWMAILGLGPSATLDDANTIYRQRAKTHAEDPDALLELNKAIEAARDHYASMGG